METKFKRITGLGLSAALLGSTALTGCSSEENSGENAGGTAQPVAEQMVDGATPQHEQTGEGGEGEGGEGEGGEGEGGEGEGGEGEGEGGEGEGGEGEGGEGEGGEGEGGEGEGGHAIATLPVEKRLAFMTGHVKAGIGLYRAGEPKMAAPHLLHPVSETHQSERNGLDALGFDASIFEAVSTALDAGQPASEIEPQLKAAEENLEAVAAKAGGDPADIISYLMSVIVEEYTIAITDGKVSDAGEYQDAWGFALVARNRAADLPEETREAVTTAIEELISLWPEAPIPPANPAPVAQVVAQTSRVLLRL